MKKSNIFTIGLISLLTIFLSSCGKGSDDVRKMDPFDLVMSIFFVLILAFVVGIIVYIIVHHFRNR